MEQSIAKQYWKKHHTKTSLSSPSIIDCLKANYGIAVPLLTLLPIGADMNASVYKVDHDKEEKRGCKRMIKLLIIKDGVTWT